jgi:medium-chain acyl-[acyl-carrier-protein] hydrolase
MFLGKSSQGMFLEKIYHQENTIGESLVGADGQIKLAKFLALIQEASLGGSDFIGASAETMKERHFYWVVMSYRFEIERMPRLDEKIIIRTYPGETKAFVYPRYYEVLDEKKNLLVRGVSLWALLNQESHKTSTPEENGVHAKAVTEEGQLAWPRTMDLGELSEKEIRKVRNSDIDFNGHMNNIRYLDFALDTEEPDFLMKNPLKSFQINFSSETRADQEMTILSGAKGKIHSYQGKVDGKNTFSLQLELK